MGSEGGLVSIESPYNHASEYVRNHLHIPFVIKAAKHVTSQIGDIPYASHMILTQVHDRVAGHKYIGDNEHDEDGITREMASDQTYIARRSAKAILLFADIGMSAGMYAAIDMACESGRPALFMSLSTEQWEQILGMPVAESLEDIETESRKMIREHFMAFWDTQTIDVEGYDYIHVPILKVFDILEHIEYKMQDYIEMREKMDKSNDAVIFFFKLIGFIVFLFIFITMVGFFTHKSLLPSADDGHTHHGNIMEF